MKNLLLFVCIACIVMLVVPATPALSANAEFQGFGTVNAGIPLFTCCTDSLKLNLFGLALMITNPDPDDKGGQSTDTILSGRIGLHWVMADELDYLTQLKLRCGVVTGGKYKDASPVISGLFLADVYPISFSISVEGTFYKDDILDEELEDIFGRYTVGVWTLEQKWHLGAGYQHLESSGTLFGFSEFKLAKYLKLGLEWHWNPDQPHRDLDTDESDHAVRFTLGITI